MQRSRPRSSRPSALVALVAVVVTVVLPQFVGVPRAAADSIVVIEGRGFGHGVGMAQDGAYWLGLSGRSATEILRTFFPGATLAKKAGSVRVSLGSGSNFTLLFSSAGTINGTRVPAGRTVNVAARDGEVVATVSTEAPTTAPVGDTPALAEDAGTPVGDAGTPVGEVGTSVGEVGEVGGRGFSVRVPAQQSTDPAVIPLTTIATTTVPPATTAPTTVAPVAEAPSNGPGAEASTTVPANVATETSAVPAAESAGDADPDAVADPATETETTKAAGPTGVSVRGTTLEASTSSTIGFAGRRYRGTMELRLVGGSVRVVNVVDVEDYLRGMGEILTPSWPAATLQAQAIAARTYALRYMAASGEICPTQRCQVYLGAQAEYPAMDKAVASTRSKVLVYQGKLIAAFYSASGGGTIATPTEAFGGDVDIPYLRAGVYPTGDLKAWRVTMTLGEVARRVGYRGSPTGIAITEVGPSGRAVTVSVYGSAGTLNVRGPSFDAALGLKSTFFTFGSGSSLGSISSASDSPTPTGQGQVAGPVGPRVPVISDDSTGNDVDVAGQNDDASALFGQGELLSVSDAASENLAPDADLAPDDTLGSDGDPIDTTATEALDPGAMVGGESAESDEAVVDSSTQVPDGGQGATESASASPARKSAADASGGSRSFVLLGGVAAAVAVGVGGLMAMRRRRVGGR